MISLSRDPGLWTFENGLVLWQPCLSPNLSTCRGGSVLALSTMSFSPEVPEVEQPEAATRYLCEKLSFMKGRSPSVSALALNGDEKVS